MVGPVDPGCGCGVLSSSGLLFDCWDVSMSWASMAASMCFSSKSSDRVASLFSKALTYSRKDVVVLLVTQSAEVVVVAMVSRE